MSVPADNVDSAVFSPDGTLVLTASNDSVRLWNASTGVEFNVLRGHENWVVSAAFSPDCTRVLTTSWDTTARLWDASTGSELCVLRNHTDVGRVVFSPDNTRVLLVMIDSTSRLWDATTGAELAFLHATASYRKTEIFRNCFVMEDGSGEKLYRWVDGTQISDADLPLECPARPTLVSKDGATGLSLRVRGLPAFAPPVLHLGTAFEFQVNPNDPLSFAAGCADGSVRFFHLEGVELPTTH